MRQHGQGHAPRRRHTRVPRVQRPQLVAVVLAGLVLSTMLVVVSAASQSPRCCAGQDPYISLYNRSLSHVESVLVNGDGQAFAAIAQDPSLARPQVIGSSSDYAYRAQRPLWSDVAWVGSGGQPALVPWVLAALAVCSGAAATWVMALVLVRRRVSPWWALLVVLVGVRAVMGFTPELAAFAFLGAGLLCWSARREGWAIAALCCAALTRESMLVGVAGLAVWELARHPRTRAAVGRVLVLGVPFVVYGLWVGFIYLRLATLPYGSSAARLGLPGVGLASALGHGTDPTSVLAGATAAALVTVLAVAVARDDILTWITAGFAGFVALLGPAVWTTDGLVRTVLPLYALGGAAILGGCAHLARRRAQVGRGSTALGSLAGADMGRR
jgi:hypothetical protein